MLMRVLVFTGLVLFSTAAQAQSQPDYIDNRTDAVSVVTSYYNAINRHEYARAWSYWHDGVPGQNYEDFANGYADTQLVTLFTGETLAEGAAGSTYYTLAAAIDAEAADGTHQAYAGCFILRLAQPTIQEPPFTPLHIESAHLRPVEGEAYLNIPETCMDAQPGED